MLLFNFFRLKAAVESFMSLRMVIMIKNAEIVYQRTRLVEFKNDDHFYRILSTYIKMHMVYDVDYPPCFEQTMFLFHEILFDEPPKNLKKHKAYDTILNQLKSAIE